MSERYTVFIDESGEAGIGKIRSETSRGASPYMTLGAVLIRNQSWVKITDALGRISADVNKSPLHCSQLNHYQILHFIRQIRKHQMRLFGVISQKSTLKEYKEVISEDSEKYYNKCVQYLLERVGWFMEARQIPRENLDIVFEKANVDYDSMCNLLRACQKTPKREFTKKLKNIDTYKISAKLKNEEPMLQVADLVAHALYKCVDKPEKNFGIPEPRYLRELSPLFFGNPDTQAVVGAGLYCVHNISQLNLDPDVAEVFMNMTATPP
ncbi:DUF3800 domain-containing protein [Rhizobium sp. RU35A]|uniref:DUF3800 domain-containing protein n=1 Tax=Rhizobium sp. RU35A TaxID=1907414 RepID=UPI00165F6CE2|nr:DUF3800 domain-containing protein [Rhizobium sp. RU35A]